MLRQLAQPLSSEARIFTSSSSGFSRPLAATASENANQARMISGAAANGLRRAVMTRYFDRVSTPGRDSAVECDIASKLAGSARCRFSPTASPSLSLPLADIATLTLLQGPTGRTPRALTPGAPRNQGQGDGE